MQFVDDVDLRHPADACLERIVRGHLRERRGVRVSQHRSIQFGHELRVSGHAVAEAVVCPFLRH